jgi:Ca2+-binding RTX toxin-like protein
VFYVEMSTVPRVVLATIALMLAGPAAANAATVKLTTTYGNEVVVAAGPGEANDLSITTSADAVMVIDRGAPTTGTGGCVGGGPPGAPVTCRLQPQRSVILTARLGDRDDALDTTGASKPLDNVDVHGGDGDDRIEGGSVGHTVNPGPGSDVVRTGAGDDEWMQKGARPDGGDLFDAGDGDDAAQYRTKYAVNVRIDGRANDGGLHENDNLDDVELVYGARKSDLLEGDDGPNVLGDGDAGYGPDDDVLRGLGGKDRLFATFGEDRLLGGRGDDSLVGGPGRDVLHGGAGNDVIDAKHATVSEPSGIDRIDCGPGTDIAIVFGHEHARNCETVKRYP